MVLLRSPGFNERVLQFIALSGILPNAFHEVVKSLAGVQFGVIVLTTSAGIMDHEEARRKKVGGKVSTSALLVLLMDSACSPNICTCGLVCGVHAHLTSAGWQYRVGLPNSS